jgi:hypothetical protein
MRSFDFRHRSVGRRTRRSHTIFYGLPAGSLVDGEITVAVTPLPNEGDRPTPRMYVDGRETDAVTLGLQGRL